MPASSIDMSGEIDETSVNINEAINKNPHYYNNKKKTEQSRMQQQANYLEVTTNLNPIPFWLAPCHLVAALFQCMQALFLFAMASQTDLLWFVYTNYPSRDDETLLEDEYAKPDPQLIGSYPITWYAGLFILLSAVDHISCIVPGFRQHYEYYIERHQAPTRWMEYSLSAALMRMHIAQVAGVTDVHLLFLIFAMTHVSLYFPALHEKMNARARAEGMTQNWSAFHCGLIPHMAVWGVIFWYFFSGINRGDPPGFALILVFSLFVLDFSFPTVFILQWKKVGIFDDYLIGELSLIGLSFTTKTFLAWTTIAGANRYSNQ